MNEWQTTEPPRDRKIIGKWNAEPLEVHECVYNPFTCSWHINSGLDFPVRKKPDEWKEIE
jgi:hypothetical protein